MDLHPNLYLFLSTGVARQCESCRPVGWRGPGWKM